MEKAFEEPKRNGYKPDLVILNSMLSIYAKDGMHDRAHEMFDLIHQCELRPDLIARNSMMDMYARGGECWEAKDTPKQLQKVWTKA